MEETKNDSHDEIKSLIEENLKINKEILRLAKKNNSMLNFQRIWGFLKLLIILIPIILGVIYLPPLIEKVFGFYQDMLGVGDGASQGITNIKDNLLKGL